MTPVRDVLIIGGGPAGLYLAQELSHRGFDVVVFEEHDATGEPVHCTGIVAADIFQKFQVPHGQGVVLNELKTACFYSPLGQRIDYSTTRDEAVVIDRGLFDRALGLQAERAGATVLRGHRVSNLTVVSDKVYLSVGSRRFAGRCCVLACGANFRFHRQLGLGVPATFLQSIQTEVTARNVEDVEMYFGNEVAPKGFSWIVPVIRNGTARARVGLMCDRRAATYFHSFRKRMAHRCNFVDSVNSVERRKVLPLSPILKTYADRVIAIGDAAGLVKATTGGGIYYSIESAAIAATILTESLRRDELMESGLIRYETAWRRHLGSELEAQMRFRSLAQELSDQQIEDLFHLSKTNSLMDVIATTARFNHHRKLILELFRHEKVRNILVSTLIG